MAQTFAPFFSTAPTNKHNVTDKVELLFISLFLGPTCSCGPCYNNGSCSSTNITGSFKCTCPPGVQGDRCRTIKINVINFGEDAYLEMVNNYLYDDEELSFEFKTTLPDGLLLYQGGVSICLR